jgi:hypothetical protein
LPLEYFPKRDLPVAQASPQEIGDALKRVCTGELEDWSMTGNDNSRKCAGGEGAGGRWVKVSSLVAIYCFY